MGDGRMYDEYPRDDDDLGETDNVEFINGGAPMILASLAEGVAGSASDPEDALSMCRDLANAEDFSEEEFRELVAEVEARTGWDLPDEDEEF